MSVEIDLRDFEKAFADLEAGLQNGAHQALVSAVKAAHEKAASSTLFNDVTGTTRANIREEMTGPLEGRVISGGKASVFLNAGTSPHEIRAKRGNTLRFVANGHTLFRKIVHHPGTKARPFMDEAAALGEQTLEYGLDLFSERPIAHFNGE